jgi:hypothetical protein
MTPSYLALSARIVKELKELDRVSGLLTICRGADTSCPRQRFSVKPLRPNSTGF